MPSTEQRKRIWSIGMFLTPVVIVKLAGALVGGPGPIRAEAAASASAGTADAAPPAAALKPVLWTDRQLSAATHVEELRVDSFGPSPLYYEPVEAVILDDEPVKATSAPAFVVKAIMSSSRGVKAVINGRPYVVGDEIRGTGWLVESIDSEGRSVVLKNPNGNRSMTIAVEKPM